MSSSDDIIRKARLFDFYARRLWPLHRLFIRTKLAQRCRRCILSERAAPLVDGLCPACRSPAPAPVAAQARDEGSIAQLDQLLRSYEGKGERRYDALLLVSGGKDSAILLHRLRTRYPGLRLLTLAIDNHFMSPVARANIDHLLRKIAVDHQLAQPSVDFCRKTFRQALLASRQHGGYEVVDRMAGDLLHDIGRNLAAEMRIPLLVTGMSRAQVERIFGVHHWEMPREIEDRPRTQSGGVAFEGLYTEEERRHWWNPELFRPEHRPRVIFPLYAWNEDESAIRRETLELGLIRPGNDSPLVTNDALIPVMGVVDIWNLGYSSFEPEFAEMVRNGKAERGFWLNVYQLLEYAALTGRLIDKEVTAVLDELGLRRAELGIDR